MSLATVWQRLASWYEDHIPAGLPLAKGASERQLARLEKLLGQPLPADVRESYLLHNGTGVSVAVAKFTTFAARLPVGNGGEGQSFRRKLPQQQVKGVCGEMTEVQQVPVSSPRKW